MFHGRQNVGFILEATGRVEGKQKTVISSRRQAWIYMYVHGKQDRICDS